MAPPVTGQRGTSRRGIAVVVAIVVAIALTIALRSCDDATPPAPPADVAAPPAVTARPPEAPPPRRPRAEAPAPATRAPEPSQADAPPAPPSPPPVAQTTPKPAAVPLEVVVTDGEGRPVVGAAVRVLDASAAERPAPTMLAATTDDAGRVVAGLRPGAAGFPVAVDHPDHPTWWGVVEANGGTAAAPERFRVKAVLERGTAIDVIVEVPAGRRATPARFRVGAVPGRTGGAAPRFPAEGDPVPPGAVFADVEAGVPTQLTRLVAGQPYHIFAVAEGWVPLLRLKAASEPAISPQLVSAEPGLVRVPMVPLYEVDVTFCELDGTPIAGSPLVEAVPSMGWTSPKELPAWATYDNPVVGLALTGPTARELVSSARLVSRAVCDVPDAPDRIPIRFEVRVPGYEPTVTDVHAVRCETVRERRQYVRLKRAVPGFGALKVRFRGPAGAPIGELGARGTITGDPRGYLALKPVAAASVSELRVALWGLDGEIEVPHVPAGRYRAFPTFELAVPSALKMQELEVRAGETTVIDLDFADWSAVEVVPLIPGVGERPYEGPLVVEFRMILPDGRSRPGMWQFTGPPYRVSGVRPAHYFVACRYGSFASREVETDAASRKVGVVRVPMTEAKFR